MSWCLALENNFWIFLIIKNKQIKHKILFITDYFGSKLPRAFVLKQLKKCLSLKVTPLFSLRDSKSNWEYFSGIMLCTSEIIPKLHLLHLQNHKPSFVLIRNTICMFSKPAFSSFNLSWHLPYAIFRLLAWLILFEKPPDAHPLWLLDLGYRWVACF